MSLKWRKALILSCIPIAFSWKQTLKVKWRRPWKSQCRWKVLESNRWLFLRVSDAALSATAQQIRIYRRLFPSPPDKLHPAHHSLSLQMYNRQHVTDSVLPTAFKFWENHFIPYQDFQHFSLFRRLHGVSPTHVVNIVKNYNTGFFKKNKPIQWRTLVKTRHWTSQ